jgi:hypothetical protein
VVAALVAATHAQRGAFRLAQGTPGLTKFQIKADRLAAIYLSLRSSIMSLAVRRMTVGRNGCFTSRPLRTSLTYGHTVILYEQH